MPDADVGTQTDTDTGSQTDTSLLADASSTSDVSDGHWSHGHEFGDGVAGQMGKFESVSDLGNSYSELQKLQGSMLSMPKEGDTDEQRTTKLNKIHDQLGRPSEAAGYKMEKPVKMPEGLEWSETAAASIKDLAYSQGWSQTQLDGAVKWQIEQQSKAIQVSQAAEADTQGEITKQRANAVDEMRAKHGNNGYENIVQGAVNVLKHHGNDSVVKKFQEAGFDRDPEVLEFLSNINTVSLKEDSLVTSDGVGPTPEGGWKAFYANPKPKG